MAAMAALCALLWLPWKSCAEEIQEAVMMEVLETTDVLEAPDTGAKLLGQLEKGDRIFAVKLAEEDWYRVAYQGEAGYVRQDVLKIYGADQGASEDLYSPDQSGASQDPQGSGQGNELENLEATGPSGEIIYPEEEFKKISAEAEKGKNSSVKITAGIFGAVILLIAADAAYTLVRAKKKAKAAGDGDIPEDIPDGMQDDIQDGMQDDFEDGQEQTDDEMEFLDLQ